MPSANHLPSTTAAYLGCVFLQAGGEASESRGGRGKAVVLLLVPLTVVFIAEVA
jgi:hypothetical protein